MKTEAIERLINAVDVWVATGVFENTVFSPVTDDAKEELKAINIAHVVVSTSKCYHENHEWKSDGDGGNLKYCNDCKCYV